ncbi:MAG: hypothetical protein ABFR89_05110 [Actinomycetota bacterium]
MAVGLLHDDLVSLPGVESADLDGDSTAPTGVRVRLAPGVDAAIVGDEVQRVLALHGLRSEVEVAPPSPATVAPFPGRVSDESAVSPSTVPIAEHDAVVAAYAESDVLESVSVTEGRDGVVVEAHAGETSAWVRAAGRIGPAFDQAIVSAVAELLGTRTEPLIRSVDSRDLGDVTVLTIVLEEAGEQHVGSAAVEGGRPYALGRAVWAALSSR